MQLFCPTPFSASHQLFSQHLARSLAWGSLQVEEEEGELGCPAGLIPREGMSRGCMGSSPSSKQTQCCQSRFPPGTAPAPEGCTRNSLQPSGQHSPSKSPSSSCFPAIL